jgi:pSer/pThr/pTyr-binding forkhead associated (FHA) protein
MIHLEVLSSRDPLALGLYEYEYDQVSMGRSKKNDLIFLDKELPLHYLVIKFIGGQLAIQSRVKEPFFFVNGKKISGTLKLKENDTIAFGNNQIRVVKALATNASDDFSAAFENFNKKSPELKFALDFIEEVLLDLEKDSHV